MLRVVAILIVGAFLALSTAVLASALLLGDGASRDSELGPLLAGVVSVAHFVGAFLLAAFGVVMLRLREDARIQGAPQRLREADEDFTAGRRDAGFLLLRRACAPLRGDSPVASADHVAEVARVVTRTFPDDVDDELKASVRGLLEAPLPLEPARLSLLLAYVDGHADVAERRAKAAVEVTQVPPA